MEAGALVGRVALITGGGSGIGRATAQAFAHTGARVVIADVNERDGRETVRLIEDDGGQALFVATDVTQAAAVETLVATTVQTYGRLDYAFNNAGINEEHGPLTEVSEALWDRIMAVNLKGIYLCMKAEIAQLLRQADGGGSAIVNTASVVGLAGSRGHPAYVASKHGIIGLTRAAARDYGPLGIRVNAVCPGTIQTPMYVQREGTDPDHDARLAAQIPLGRLGRPQDIADAVLWLCSDAAAFVTGHTLVVDGGDTV
jgi:NAD(P)-dependent dehydrogenase (short-subunit alcohol dehydrogenase family)